jgi:hypothetical protein
MTLKNRVIKLLHKELVGGTDLPVTDGKLTLSLKAEDVAVIVQQ